MRFHAFSFYVSALIIAAPAAGLADEHCAKALYSAESALRDVPGGLARHEFYDLTKIPTASDVTAVKLLAKQYGVEDVDSEYFVDYVDGVFRRIKTEGDNPLQSGEKMAEFGGKLDAYVSNLRTKEARKASRYALADAVATLEEFKPEECQGAPDARWKELGPSFVHSDEFMAYTKGYIDDRAPYSTRSWGEGLLSLADVRDGASNNFLPLEAKTHDMRPIHYSTGHPRPVAIFFKNARGHNALRFVLQQAMFAGVDTVQFIHETELAKYMAQKRGMDLEEAMLFIGGATRAELEQIVDGAKIRGSVESSVNSFATWAPKDRDGKTRDQETEQFLDRGMAFLGRPALRKYTNYALDPRHGVGADRDFSDIVWSGRSVKEGL